MASELGPDIAIIGAARSGTSFLSACLGRHESVDQGSMKEPNYFSSAWSRGPKWYDDLFAPRSAGLVRLDSSVSYTYPQHKDALRRLSEASPGAHIIYGVRHPFDRLVSHYHLFHHYARPEEWLSLADGIERSDMFLAAGDYGEWLEHASRYFAPERILVVPFPLMTAGLGGTLPDILRWLGLPPDESSSQLVAASSNYQNEAREFRSRTVQTVHRWVHRSGLYPRLRSVIGADRLRRARNAATRAVKPLSTEEELRTLTASQRALVVDRARPAVVAVSEWLRAQDERLEVQWSKTWADHVADL